MIRSGVPGKLGVIRLKGSELTRLRMRCWLRDDKRCVVCMRCVNFESFEMAHIVGRGRGGSDILENVQTKCGFGGCHYAEHNPKAVPRRPDAL